MSYDSAVAEMYWPVPFVSVLDSCYVDHSTFPVGGHYVETSCPSADVLVRASYPEPGTVPGVGVVPKGAVQLVAVALSAIVAGIGDAFPSGVAVDTSNVAVARLTHPRCRHGVKAGGKLRYSPSHSGSWPYKFKLNNEGRGRPLPSVDGSRWPRNPWSLLLRHPWIVPRCVLVPLLVASPIMRPIIIR